MKAKRIVIVGGGSAGWMTAAYLSRALDQNVSITLVESPNVPTVGVGEATFSTLKLYFDFLGLQEHQWMPSCNATYKMAIRFVNWSKEPGYFYHPFQRYQTVDGFNLGDWWLKLRTEESFDQACFTVAALCDNMRSPRHLDGSVFDDKVQMHYADEHIAKRNVLQDHMVQFPYGYHFDASLLAKFLQNYGIGRGVQHVLGNVSDVKLNAEGAIAFIQLETGAPIEADLFIDCTGFQGLLINKALKEPFISFQDSLLCDSAVAMQVPTNIAERGIEPFTTATALSAGWVWNIPLYGRIGTGYVYSSKFISKEEAEAAFRRHLGPASDDCVARHIKMRIGRNRNSWVKNCVAIGLSSGFVEPLESTGIFFIQHGIEALVSHFQSGEFDAEMIRSYNEAVANCIDGVRDFLILHYRAGTRTDTEFWRANKETPLPEALAKRLALWKRMLPSARTIKSEYHGFEFYSYSVMLMGLGSVPQGNLPALDHIDPTNAKRAFEAIKSKGAKLVAELPSQYEYLSHVRAQTV